MNISPLNVITWLHHSIKNVKLPYPVPALNLVDDNNNSSSNNNDNKNGNKNNLNHYMVVNDKEGAIVLTLLLIDLFQLN